MDFLERKECFGVGLHEGEPQYHSQKIEKQFFMKKMPTRHLLPALLLFLLACPVHAQSSHQSLRQGDQAYDKKEYQNAENAYRKALTQSPSDPTALYNTGNAAYRQGHYEDAVGLYTEAAKQAPDPVFKAQALYNLGNAHLKQEHYQKAIEAYEQSLRLRPGDGNTKSNLQFAKKKQHEKEQKEKQQQQNQQQKPQDQQQNQDPQKEPQPSEQDQQQNDQSQPSDQNPNQPKPDKQAAPKPGRITPEQARQTLENSIGPADQKSARKYRENQRPPARPRPKKDW